MSPSWTRSPRSPRHVPATGSACGRAECSAAQYGGSFRFPWTTGSVTARTTPPTTVAPR